MASVNKVCVDIDRLRMLYVEEGKSIPAVSKEMGLSISTTRARLSEIGVIRGRSESIRLAAKQGNLGSGHRGKNREFTQEWKEKISAARLKHGEMNAKGVSMSGHGYLKYTRGPNKDRSVHVVLIEKQIGRQITKNEVVHHKDHDKLNNSQNNLQLMTRSEHSRIHAIENEPNRKRASDGKFE